MFGWFFRVHYIWQFFETWSQELTMYFKVIISIIDGELMCKCGKLKLVVESIFAMVTLSKMCLIKLITILKNVLGTLNPFSFFRFIQVHNDIYWNHRYINMSHIMSDVQWL